MPVKQNSILPFSHAAAVLSEALVTAALAVFKPAGGRESGPPRPALLDASRRVLTETHGAMRGALLAVRARALYDRLYALRPPFRRPALRRHLERNILPGLALYRTLLEEHGARAAALAESDRIFAAVIERSFRRRLVRIIGRFGPGFAFVCLRIANRMILRLSYPREGWECEWRENSRRCIAYDISRCFYLTVLTAYGAPELTGSFCRLDDILFGSLPGVSWERAKTLGRGDDRCDFRFHRRPDEPGRRGSSKANRPARFP